MTVRELKRLKTTLEMEVEWFLRGRLYNPIGLEEFCWKIAEYYRPANTNAMFESDMAMYALRHGKDIIEQQN